MSETQPETGRLANALQIARQPKNRGNIIAGVILAGLVASVTGHAAVEATPHVASAVHYFDPADREIETRSKTLAHAVESDPRATKIAYGLDTIYALQLGCDGSQETIYTSIAVSIDETYNPARPTADNRIDDGLTALFYDRFTSSQQHSSNLIINHHGYDWALQTQQHGIDANSDYHFKDYVRAPKAKHITRPQIGPIFDQLDVVAAQLKAGDGCTTEPDLPQ